MIARVDILCLADPSAAMNGGALRLRGLAALLRDQGIDVEFLYPAAAVGETIRRHSTSVVGSTERSLVSRALGKIGDVKRFYLPMPTVMGARDKFLESRVRDATPTITIISALSLTQYVKYCSGPIWLDFMDVWSVFAEREAEHRKGLSAATSRLQAAWLARTEEIAAGKAAIVTAAGWNDADVLRRRDISAHWLPVWLDPPTVQITPDLSNRTAGMIGNFDYWPNRDAYDVLRTHWLPVLRSQGWDVVVAGPGSEQLAPADGVRLMGRVSDLGDFYSRISVSLAPIRLGGGIKVKVIESLLSGVPVLGTPASVEGLDPLSMQGVTVCSHFGPTPEQLGAAVSTRVSSDSLASYTRAGASDAVTRLLESLELSS